MIYIKQIKIQDFKNFTTEQTFEFTPNVNIISGKNGCGKTTILDAIIWCLVGKLYNSSKDGWKPKELYTDVDGNATSKWKDLFNTLVEITIAFDNGQKDIVIKRTSCCGRSTTLYYNGICDTQKQINKYLEDALGFDLTKLLIFTNPEYLFNTSDISQQQCGELIYDSVYKTVKNDLTELYTHLFDNYNSVLSTLEDNTLEKVIAKKILTNVKKQLDSNISENEVIEDLQAQIDENTKVLEVKNETIKSQELILNEYYQKLKQEETYKQMGQNLDKAEQMLRQNLYEKSKIIEEFSAAEKDKNQLVVWLDDFNNLLSKNPSINDIKRAFGIQVIEAPSNKPVNKINVLSQAAQKIKCPVCGNWYVPTPTDAQKKVQEQLAVLNKQIVQTNTQAIITNKALVVQQQQEQKQEIFDYLPKLTQIKEQISDYKKKLDQLQAQIDTIDRNIALLDYKTVDEIQTERNNISKFFAALDSGKNVQKQVNNMKADCEECNLNNKYMNILLETVKQYIKAKLKIITDKLNNNLTSGFLQLYKIQANGTIKQSITIVDKYSNATYDETNQSNKIKLGIEVCKLLQDFNNINFPLFLDEVGRFSDHSFIKSLGHQIIATMPTNEEQLNIKQEQ